MAVETQVAVEDFVDVITMVNKITHLIVTARSAEIKMGLGYGKRPH